MDEISHEYKVHVFVCTNKKDGKACCADRHGEDLRSELKSWAKENPEWRKKIRINSSGCLDRCKEGVVVAVYPQDRWLINVNGKKDVSEVKEFITGIMNEALKT